MPKIAVYGSLREGEYNHARFKNYYEDIRVIAHAEVQGYDLFDLGMYPGIKPGTGKIVVDVLEVNEQCADHILRMEQGAGYHAKSITVDGHECVIYIYNGPVAKEAQVPSGDWVNRHPVG